MNTAKQRRPRPRRDYAGSAVFMGPGQPPCGFRDDSDLGVAYAVRPVRRHITGRATAVQMITGDKAQASRRSETFTARLRK